MNEWNSKDYVSYKNVINIECNRKRRIIGEIFYVLRGYFEILKEYDREI